MVRVGLAFVALLLVAPSAQAAFQIQYGNVFQQTVVFACDSAPISEQPPNGGPPLANCQKFGPLDARPYHIDFVTCVVSQGNGYVIGLYRSALDLQNHKPAYLLPVTDIDFERTTATAAISVFVPGGSQPRLEVTVDPPATRIRAECTISGSVFPATP